MMPGKTAQPITALIDIGNTRMKIGWVDPASGEREHRALALAHDQADQLVTWFSEWNIRPVKAVGVNVAGVDKARAIEDLFSNTYRTAIRWLGSQTQAAGVLNRYGEPLQLGADRWIAMVGLGQNPPLDRPMLLASFGTATTLDTLCPARMAGPALNPAPDEVRWIFEGGLIFPGPGLMRASLASNTAQLPVANGTTTSFPTDTHRAITTGIAAAQAGAVVRQWQAGLQRYGIAPLVYGTGGGWCAVQDEVQTLLAFMQRQHQLAEQPIQYLPSPILDGLARMASGR